MKLESLRLKGSKGIRAGMGLEEIFIDLTKIPAGLIAVVGENGKGKTTILDNLHPFRMMPYKMRKCKNWSPAAFTYYDQFYGSDGINELIFEMGGERYRKYILIDADRKKQEAYFYKEVDGEWKPFEENGIAKSDGKTATYDAAVEAVCGSPSLFFTSVFRSQGAKNLSDYTRGDIMEIIAELLNINHIKEQGAKAGEVEKHLKALIALDNSKLDMLKESIDNHDELTATLNNKKQIIGNYEFIISKTTKEIEEKKVELSDIEKKEAARESEKARLKDLTDVQAQDGASLLLLDGEKKEHEAAFVTATVDTNEKLTRAEQSIVTLNEEKKEHETSLETATVDINKKLATVEKIVSGEKEIREKVVEENTKNDEMAKKKAYLLEEETEKETLESRKGRLAEKEKGFSDIKIQLNEAKSLHEREIQSAKTTLDQAEREAAKLDGVDCKGDGAAWINEGCLFIKDAAEARTSLEKLRADLEEKSKPSAKILELEKDLKGLPAVETELKDIAELQTRNNELISDYRTAISAFEAELTEIARWTKLVPQIDRAAEDIERLTTDLKVKGEEKTKAIDRVIIQIGKAREDIESLKADIATKDKERVKALEKIDGKKADIETRISERAIDITRLTAALGQNMETLTRDITNAMQEKATELRSIENNKELVQGEIGNLNGKFEEIVKKQGEIKVIDKRVASINKEIAKWSLLAKVCSNDGIIALEIDDAGPGIAGIANELLAECYGSRYSVKIVTQSAKASGGMKEDFDITVLDSETGESASITEKSGGQVTYVEDAIVRAICLMNIRSSERVFDSLFSDEKDGALDEDKKQAFIAVKHKALELGTHNNEFFITQSRELQEMSDARIVLGDKGITIQ
jgi:exonuclease SbcC